MGHSGTAAMDNDTEQSAVSARPKADGALRWVRAHPFRTLLLLVGVAVLYELATIPWFSVAQLAVLNPSRTALMTQRLDEAEDAGKPLRIVQRWVPLARVPD